MSLTLNTRQRALVQRRDRTATSQQQPYGKSAEKQRCDAEARVDKLENLESEQKVRLQRVTDLAR